MPGPAPGQRCTVCNSPERQAIEAADTAGVSRREIARRYGLGKDVVNRHLYNHPPLGDSVPDSPEAGASEPPSGDVLPGEPPEPDELSEVERLRVTRAILVKEMEKDPRSDTAREIRQISERIGVLSGEHRARTARVEDVEGLPELVAAWARALEPWPEARAAMIAATPEDLRP